MIMRYRCGTKYEPHVIDEINGYGVCRNCGDKFKDGVKVNDLATSESGDDEGSSNPPSSPSEYDTGRNTDGKS